MYFTVFILSCSLTFTVPHWWNLTLKNETALVYEYVSENNQLVQHVGKNRNVLLSVFIVCLQGAGLIRLMLVFHRGLNVSQ